MEIYDLLSLTVYDKEIGRWFINAHVRVDLFLYCDIIAVKKHADSFDVLLLLWGDDLTFVRLKHPVVWKHFV